MDSNNERVATTTLIKGQWYADISRCHGFNTTTFLKYDHCTDNKIFFSEQINDMYFSSSKGIGFSESQTWFEPIGEDLEIIAEYEKNSNLNK